MEAYNDHWRPYWLHCNLCKRKYDIIGKFDTIAEDAEVVQGEGDQATYPRGGQAGGQRPSGVPLDQ